MKTYEKTRLDAEAKGKQAEGARNEVDLRAGQIDKLTQEMTFYSEEVDKYLREQQDLLSRAEQEQQEEERQEEKKREQIAMNAALAMENNNSQ